ncbi:IS5/IS1182 family transposase, partial [Neisseria meningitidis]
MITKRIDRSPLLKLDQVIDWQPTEQYLNREKPRCLPRPPGSSRLSPVVHVQS